MISLKENSDLFNKNNLDWSVVIIGAGPSGMAAASACANLGIKVLLLDEQDRVGGQIYRNISSNNSDLKNILGVDYTYGSNLANSVKDLNVSYVANAVVWQVTRNKKVSFTSPQGSVTVKANNIVLATGAMERPFPIPGWTLPGVMTIGAAQTLLKTSGIIPNQETVLVGCGPLLYLLAQQYINANVEIKAIVDTSSSGNLKKSVPQLIQALSSYKYLLKGREMLKSIKNSKIPFYKNATNLKVLGKDKAQGISFESNGKTIDLNASLVLLHQGVIPNTQISWSLRAEHIWDAEQLCWVPVVDEDGQLEIKGIYVAGDGSGIGGAKVAELQGQLSGLAIAKNINMLDQAQFNKFSTEIKNKLKKELAIRPFLDSMYKPTDQTRIPTGNTIVCRCENVTAQEIEEFVNMGCSGPNQAKSFGRCGMGPCQGRMCGVTVTEIIASRRKLDASEVGYYRLRPPIKPITLAELAGETNG